MILGKSKSNNLLNEIIAQQKQKQSQIPVIGKPKQWAICATQQLLKILIRRLKKVKLQNQRNSQLLQTCKIVVRAGPERVFKFLS